MFYQRDFVEFVASVHVLCSTGLAGVANAGLYFVRMLRLVERPTTATVTLKHLRIMRVCVSENIKSLSAAHRLLDPFLRGSPMMTTYWTCQIGMYYGQVDDHASMQSYYGN